MDITPAAPQVDLLFEVSWEVCNKIGGIYTVLSTKAKTLQKLYNDKTVFIGPDVWTEENPSPWFTECNVEGLSSWSKTAKLPEGVSVRVGRWDIPGRPIAVLVKFDGMYAVKDEFYGEMWKRFGVDSLHAYGDYDEGCAFAHAAGVVIESIIASGYGAKLTPTGRISRKHRSRIVAHFDEWTTGMGLLYVKWKLPQVATVFTTHATSIGRSICGNNKPLYDYLKGYNGDQMARELNMEAKHSLEKRAAHAADVFTTVSDITAAECEQLLERRPDVVTPNGFEKNFVPSPSKFPAARKQARDRMLTVASALTGKRMDDNTFIVVTSGRCEYRNKGLDLFLDVCDKLRNRKLCRDVLAFVMVPAWAKEARKDLTDRIAGMNNTPFVNDEQALADPVLTHWLNNPDSDAVNCRMHQLGFANQDPRVTVIYVPCYLNGNDGVFNLSYYDLLPGADATVFPSYYEPWGYTPLESVAFGVPTVTTSLSGFGQWALKTSENYFDECGVNVIGRGDSNYESVVDNIAHSLEYLTCADEKEIKKIHKAAMHTASEAAWPKFMVYYDEAYALALSKAEERTPAAKKSK
ncbi:glycosyltransferase [uncultured Duncaniella sp.]|uniref:glycosyltransferase n=3 Tax=uncultured Duncaniella sp. TaxID=2768039 RepID=UPI0025EA0397|nr:glycosyltransferase [uncultured Duncaniella sp.]